jgi:hypothetical protein
MLTWLLLLKLSSTKQVIPNVPFFRGQPNGMIDFILSFLETCIAVRNELVYMQVICPSSAFSNSNLPESICPVLQNSPANTMYFLAEGRCRVTIRDNPNEVNMIVITPRQIRVEFYVRAFNLFPNLPLSHRLLSPASRLPTQGSATATLKVNRLSKPPCPNSESWPYFGLTLYL